MFVKTAEQLQQVAAASLGFDVVLIEQRVTNLDHSARLSDQAPDDRANRVESKISPALEIENCGLAFEIAGNLILGGDYD